MQRFPWVRAESRPVSGCVWPGLSMSSRSARPEIGWHRGADAPGPTFQPIDGNCSRCGQELLEPRDCPTPPDVQLAPRSGLGQPRESAEPGSPGAGSIHACAFLPDPSPCSFLVFFSSSVSFFPSLLSCPQFGSRAPPTRRALPAPEQPGSEALLGGEASTGRGQSVG